MPLGRTRKDLQQHTQQVPDIPFPLPWYTIASLTAKNNQTLQCSKCVLLRNRNR